MKSWTEVDRQGSSTSHQFTTFQWTETRPGSFCLVSTQIFISLTISLSIHWLTDFVEPMVLIEQNTCNGLSWNPSAVYMFGPLVLIQKAVETCILSEVWFVPHLYYYIIIIDLRSISVLFMYRYEILKWWLKLNIKRNSNMK